MLNVSASIIIPPNVSIDTPNKYLVPIPIGQLSRVLISFPYGAGWLVGVSLWYQNFPLLPIHRNTWIKGNDYTFDLHSTRNLNQDPFEIEVRGYNLDTVFQHEILFVFEINERIGLSDVEKETLKFMSQFSEILITTEGEVGEISSPLHVSTKVLTRPDYMTGTRIVKTYDALVGNDNGTVRWTYTVPTGKRAFVEVASLISQFAGGAGGYGSSFSIITSSVTYVFVRKIVSNTVTSFLDVDPIIQRIYLKEGESLILTTYNFNVANVEVGGTALIWEFDVTQ